MEGKIEQTDKPKRVPRRYIVELVQDGEVSHYPSYTDACHAAGLRGDAIQVHGILNRFKYHQKDWMLKGIQVDVENIEPFTVRRIQFREA